MQKIFLLLSFLLLTGCAPHAFPVKTPPSDVLDAKYKAWKHTLADNAQYHFSILIPNEWKILQTTVAKEPSGDKPLELALFREPGAWMDDAAAPVDGEFVVQVVSLSGSILSSSSKEAPLSWLKQRLKRSLGEYTLLKERTFSSLYGPTADLLIASGAGDQVVISRFSAVHAPADPDKLFVLTCSAMEAGYERIAEACITGIETFNLVNADPKKPATSSGGIRATP